ncbi:MAG: SpoVR family protein [Acidobacteria bacterium]|nr:SpoVR family protein [Acidobacteriota bacterium]
MIEKLPTELKRCKYRVHAVAREYGLRFPEIIYEVLDYEAMNRVAAYAGFPQRYPHWSFGMQYDQHAKSYRYGLSRIYEMVVNSRPVYAYLLKCNNLVDQKLVMAHVCGHGDFFGENLWFGRTDRKALDTFANHGSAVQKYIDQHGAAEVEKFLDICLSLQQLVDIHSQFIRRKPNGNRNGGQSEESGPESVRKLPVERHYMDSFLNPREHVEAQRKELEKKKRERELLKIPESPERDVLLFLIEHAPLENWQRDILGMIRQESYYYLPQAQTKIMNEGWASFWHSKILTGSDKGNAYVQPAPDPVLEAAEVVDYADHCSGTLAMGRRLNPYKLGLAIWRDLEERWNRGQFGKEWEECDDFQEKSHWDRKLGQGRQKIFEVRRIYNDVQFIDEFFTPEISQHLKLFAYRYERSSNTYKITSRAYDEIKRKLLFSLTNYGSPVVEVENANFKNRGELFLRHVLHEGVDLDLKKAAATLEYFHWLWKRPVYLVTVVKEEEIALKFDGTHHQIPAAKLASIQ